MLMVLRWEYEQEAARQQRFGRSHFAQHHFGGDMENVNCPVRVQAKPEYYLCNCQWGACVAADQMRLDACNTATRICAAF